MTTARPPLAPPVQNRSVERHRARAEFRRSSRDSPWILAGVWIDHVDFQAIAPGVEPLTGRLPDTGLLGWFDLPTVIAPDARAAGEAALQIAQQAFPRMVRARVPFGAMD